jgi:hypothetical protein
MSKLLDLHLSRAIAREHLKDRVMRKFIQLAEDVEADLKELDNDADELDRRRRNGKERAKAVVNTHHQLQDRIDEGIAALEKVADDAGISRQNRRTAAELAAIEAEETANQAKLKGETQVVSAEDVGKLPDGIVEPPAEGMVDGDPLSAGQLAKDSSGEASGDTPLDATFQKAAE